MGLFSFTQELAIDLGTANTIIVSDGKIVVDAPSVIALDKRTDKVLAVGETARQMHGKTHENIRTVRPLQDGVIADFYAAEQMIRGLIKMIHFRHRWFSPPLRVVTSSVPVTGSKLARMVSVKTADDIPKAKVRAVVESLCGITVEAPIAIGDVIVRNAAGTGVDLVATRRA